MTCGDLYLDTVGFQFSGKSAQAVQIACVEQHAPDERRQTAGTAGTDVSRCSHDEESRCSQVAVFQGAHLPNPLHDETDSQRIARGEDCIASCGKLIEV